MRVYTTIITSNYIGYALTLRESLQPYGRLLFYLLIADDGPVDKEALAKDYPDVRLLFINDLCREGMGKALLEKYQQSYIDGFRWSMKPVLLKYLLNQEGHDRALFLDPDLFFFSDPGFLFDALQTDDFILTPHWRARDPFRDSNNFYKLFKEGQYNAGFVGASKQAGPILDWWASACLFHCSKDPGKALYVDQAYLNLLPIYFDRVRIIRQRGCNVAEWSRTENARKRDNGTILVGGDPLVFMHFTQGTIETIARGDDPVLEPCLEQYEQTANRYGIRLQKIPPPPQLSTAERLLPAFLLRPLRKIKWMFIKPESQQ